MFRNQSHASHHQHAARDAPVVYGVDEKGSLAPLVLLVCSENGLEGYLSSDLDEARRGVEAQEVAIGTGRGSGHSQDVTEGGVAEAAIGNGVIRVVEDIEGLGAQAERVL